MSLLFLQIPEGWVEVEQAPAFTAMWEREQAGVPVPRAFQHRDGRTAMMGREPYAADDLRWHISLRYGDPGKDGRLPTWEELVNTAHELRPGVPFVIGIPPRSWWMNVHNHVLHMVETKDEAMIENWRRNASGHRPT